MKRHIIIGPDTRVVTLGGRPPRVVLWLLVQQIGLFLLYAFANGPAWVTAYLAASAGQTLGQLYLYQPLTALWIHLAARGVILNSVSLWIFGSTMERFWGGRRLLLFWVVTGVVGLVVGVLFGLLQPAVAVAGSSGSALALMLGVALTFPRNLVLLGRIGALPLKARELSLILAGLVLLGSLVSGLYLELAVQAGGALAALLFVHLPRQMAARRRKSGPFEVLRGGRDSKKRRRYWN